MEHKGEVAKLRRIIRKYDEILSLIEPEPGVEVHPFDAQNLQQLMQDTLRARLVAANILMRYGDDSGYQTHPRIIVSLEYDHARPD
jgi:hypothetical protein